MNPWRAAMFPKLLKLEFTKSLEFLRCVIQKGYELKRNIAGKTERKGGLEGKERERESIPDGKVPKRASKYCQSCNIRRKKAKNVMKEIYPQM